MTDGAPPTGATGGDTQSRVLMGRMPDITPAQLVGVIGAVIAVAVSFGINVSREQQEAILAVAGAVAAILFAADAHVRTRRAHAEAVRHLADQHADAVRHVAEKHHDIAMKALAAGQPPPALIFPPPPTAPGR